MFETFERKRPLTSPQRMNRSGSRHSTLHILTTCRQSAMFLIVLLLACVSAEWVEISQQHYRKPLRAYAPFTTHNKVSDIEETTQPWTYTNHSITENNWNKHNVYANHGYTTDGYFDKTDYGPERPSGAVKASFDNGDAAKGIVVRVPDVGNVRRVQLNSSPVKLPNIKLETHTGQNIFNTGYSDELDEVIFQQNMNFPPNEDRISLNNDRITQKPHLIKGNSKIIVNETDSNKKIKHGFKNHTTVNSPKHIFLNGNPSQDIAPNFNIVTTEADCHTAHNTVTEQILGTQRATPIDNEEKYRINEQPTLEHKSNGDSNRDKKDPMQNYKPSSQVDEQNKVNITKSVRADTVEKVMKFMMVVADTISTNSRRSFNGKLRYLKELKDNILANIEQRIDATWPEEDGTRRRSRSVLAQATARGHVQFPSSESSLMTISFLTFAVFLIKLVLQVIQTYKNKTMMVAPLVVAAAGRSAFEHRQHD